MTDTEAQQALLVRAFETPLAPPWTEADAAWASAEAARIEGERAAAERLVASRARLAAQRLTARDPAIAAAFNAASNSTARNAWAWAAVAIAFGFGLALDAIGPTHRLNIIALPMLGVLVWNVAVYGLLAVRALRGGSDPAPGSQWLMAQAARARSKPRVRALAGGEGAAALRRFAADHAAAVQPLIAGRIAFVFHAAAAAVAAGLLASMYGRGLAFDYRAGWDSTFLGAEGVRQLLSVLLWPALTVARDTLPGVAEIATLRFSVGNGESAARWIHWLALNVALVVLLPRSLLAAQAAWRTRRLARQWPIDLSEPYFQRLVRTAHHDETLAVQVLPYSYRLAPDLLPGLQAVVRRAFGAGAELNVADSLPAGSEDDLPHRLQRTEGTTQSLRVPLFAMTATPERETHGALVRALQEHERAASQAPAGKAMHDALVDESAFRRSFDATRLAQRRAAWQQLLADAGWRAVFVDLSQPDLAALDAALAQPRAEAPA